MKYDYWKMTRATKRIRQTVPRLTRRYCSRIAFAVSCRVSIRENDIDQPLAPEERKFDVKRERTTIEIQQLEKTKGTACSRFDTRIALFNHFRFIFTFWDLPFSFPSLSTTSNDRKTRHFEYVVSVVHWSLRQQRLASLVINEGSCLHRQSSSEVSPRLSLSLIPDPNRLISREEKPSKDLRDALHVWTSRISREQKYLVIYRTRDRFSC